MTELRFHRELYDAAAVADAVQVYGAYGTLELSEEPGYWLVRLSAPAESRQRRLARELSNHALGMTIKGRKVAG